MDKNNTPTLLIPLLALLALFFPFAMNVGSPSPPSENNQQATQSAPRQQEKKKKASTGLPPHSAAKLIEDFLHARRDRGISPDGDPRSHYSLDFMIATVPDPIDSRLPYLFDSSIDSIQRACEADGYVLDRYDLAWSEPAGKVSDSETAKEPDRRRYRWKPSLLLFRKSPEEKHSANGNREEQSNANDTEKNEENGTLLLVFLVGETPTAGIHKTAMSSALRQIGSFFFKDQGFGKLTEELHKLKLTQHDSRLRIDIMGPTFSGSAVSLEFALRDWLVKLSALAKSKNDISFPDFEIISGTATAIEPHEFSEIGKDEQLTVKFKAVMPPDRKSIRRILKYIHDLGYLGGREVGFQRIAILTEANTAYGRQTLPGVLTLPFPLHISELREKSEKQRVSQQKPTSTVVTSPTPSIPIGEGETSQPSETPPSFSNLEMPSEELVLSKLLSTVSNEGYDAVGILATDVRDTIFLAREIHLHCPGTLVFSTDSDLLYMHPDASTATRGMLVFTPYSLLNLDQVWTAPFSGMKSRLQFSSQAAEGVYNATVALLKQEEGHSPILDYGRPFQSQDLEGPEKSGEEKPPEEAEEKPALWVTVVGRNGLLPVTLLPWRNSGNYSLSVPRSSQAKPNMIDRPGIYTPNAALGVALLSAVLIAFSLAVLRQYKSPASMDGSSRFLGEPITPEYQSQARLFMLACLVCLLSPYVVVIAVYSLPAIASHQLGTIFTVQWWQLLVATVLVVGLVFLLRAIYVVFLAYWEIRKQSPLLRPVVRGVVFCGCLLVIVLSLLLAGVWVHTGWKDPTEAIFTYVRAFEFSSGVSPLVPLFCLAVAGFLWASCSFWRLRMIDGVWRPSAENVGEQCLLNANTSSFKGIIDLENQTRDRLEQGSAFPTRLYVALIVVGGLAAMYLFFSPFVPSYEGRRFYFLFGWGFFLVYAALATEFGRLCLTWAALRRLLQRLALHPMQAAYERYRKSFPGFPRIDLAIPLKGFTVLSFSVDQAKRLLNVASSLVSSKALPETERQNLKRWLGHAQPIVEAASDDLTEALLRSSTGKWRPAIESCSRSQHALGELTRVTAEFLEPSWYEKTTVPPASEHGKETVPPTSEHAKEAAPPASKENDLEEFRKLGAEFLAGRTVQLISYVLPSLRNLGVLVLTGLLVMLFSAVSYPFLQRNHLLVFNWVVILSFVGLALVVLLQMERDAVLSALNDTKPGQVKVTRQFSFRMLTYVLIPILALLSAQFPDTVGRILTWFSSAQGH